MSRPRKGPRLYLRPARAGRGAVYVIRDGAREIGTGCGPDRHRDAEAALAAYLAARYFPPPSTGKALADILIADVVAAYLTEHAPTTASGPWIAHTAAPVMDWWGDKTLADVRGASCRAYVAWRTAQTVGGTERPVTPATARHELKTLRAAIGHWHREHGPLPSVPAVTLPERGEPRDRWLTRDEAAAMIRAARRTRQIRHVARVILIGVYTGTRPGAILALRWLPSTGGGWFDLEAGVLHRRAAGARRSRKRQPPARIPDRLMPHLRRWHAADMKRAKPVVNVIHYGGRPVAKLRRSWARAAAIAGIEDGVTPHVVRHTAATWMMQGGADIYAAAGYLGMSPQTLEVVYGHHHPDFQDRAANVARSRKSGGRGTARERPPGAPLKSPVNHRD